MASPRHSAGTSDALSLPRGRPEPPSGPHAAPAIWCDSVQLFLRQFTAAPIKRGDDPYVDPLAVRSFPACSIELDGPWAGVDPGRTPWDALGQWLEAQGFARDLRYDADAPDGTSALYRRGDRLCAYAASFRLEGKAAGNEDGGPVDEPPTRYRLTVWSSAAR